MAIGFDIGMVIHRREGDITSDEVGEFNHRFIDLVESFGWIHGGGLHMVDVDEEVVMPAWDAAFGAVSRIARAAVWLDNGCLCKVCLRAALKEVKE